MRQWTFLAGFYWIGMPSEYKTKSLPNSLVNYSNHTQIWNNKSMFALGISFDFSRGKSNSINKKNQNNTTPALKF